MKRQMKKLIVSAVALSLVIPALSAPKAEAAKKPSLVKKVSVKAGKTKKVTVKGVKTKQIKKTTWSVKSKKVVTLSKKKKNSVTIKGKKAGKTVLTAKIKVGKKTYKKTCNLYILVCSAVIFTPVMSKSLCFLIWSVKVYCFGSMAFTCFISGECAVVYRHIFRSIHLYKMSVFHVFKCDTI